MDMFGMLGKLNELQSKLKEAQEGMKNVTATGEAGAGMVRATANGLRQVLKIEIDESLMVKEDREVLADLIVAAVNKAMEEATNKAQDEVKSKTEGLLPNIPGFDIGNFGK